jgi:hypothetical protein
LRGADDVFLGFGLALRLPKTLEDVLRFKI